MTEARKAALEHLHSQGEIACPYGYSLCISRTTLNRLLNEKLIENDFGLWSLTDKGRRALHGDSQ